MMMWVTFLLMPIALTIASDVDVEELYVGIEFSEYDLEDLCVAKNNALRKIYNGTSPNFSELYETQLKFYETVHNLSASNRIHIFTEFKNPKLQRKLEMIYKPGPSLLDGENITVFTKFAVDATTATSAPVKGSTLTRLQVNDILYKEKNATRVAAVWKEWQSNLEPLGNRSEQQMEILQQEAIANGFERVDSYWLHQSEIAMINYEQATNLWLSIAPLYQKLRQFLARAIVPKFGSSVFYDTKLIPAQVLGSLDSSDWVTAVESLDALKDSKSFQTVQKSLKDKSMKELYKYADETTAELRLGHVPDLYFKLSQFNVDNRSCVHHVDVNCKTDLEYFPGVLTCKNEPSTMSSFLRSHEEVARLKHMVQAGKEELENGYLFKEGLTDSVLYEAIATAISLLAVHPANLQRRGLLPNKTEDANMTSLLLSALQIIPPLPYHLAADNWRLTVLYPPQPVIATSPLPVNSSPAPNVTEETANEVDTDKQTEKDDEYDDYDNEKQDEVTEATVISEREEEGAPEVKVKVNLTKEWWSLRGKYQGVGPPDDKLYHDYLNDDKIVWNKPHISKFLGPILLFQILEHFKGGNTSDNLNLLTQILHSGNSRNWEKLVADLFNITEIRTEPLLNYFKPLETFLDGGAKFQANSGSAKAFSDNDLRTFLMAADVSEMNKKGIVNYSSPRVSTDPSSVRESSSVNFPGAVPTLASQSNHFLFSLGLNTSSSPNLLDKDIKSASEDSNALLIALVVLALVGIGAVVVTVIKKRLTKKKRSQRRRKLDQMS